MPVTLTHSKQIIELLKEYKIDCTPYEHINFEAMTKYKYFAQKSVKFNPEEFIPTEEELKANPLLLKLITSTLFNDSFDFIEDDTLISEAYFKNKLIEVQNYIQTCYSSFSPNERAIKIDAIEFLVCQMIGLRLVKEIRERNIPFPYEKISQQDADRDLQSLKTNLRQLGHTNTKKLRPLKFNQSFPQVMDGYSVSARYMDQHRYAVSNARRGKENFSPASAWKKDNLASFICGHLRQAAMKARKNAAKKHNQSDRYEFGKFEMSLSTNKIIYELCRKYGVNQSHPLYVGALIQFIKKNYQSEVESYLDLCMGWGDRLVGAFGASVLGLKRYVGTDPNTALVPAYNNIIGNHQPIGFQSFIYSKPMENCTPEELCPEGKANQMMYTSPPYFDLENYPGENQSHVLYKDYPTWRGQFLYTLVEQAKKGLQVGGYIAIEMGTAVDKQRDIQGDLMSYVAQCTYLTSLGEFSNKRFSTTPTFLIKFTGDNSLHKSLPLAAPVDDDDFKDEGEEIIDISEIMNSEDLNQELTEIIDISEIMSSEDLEQELTVEIDDMPSAHEERMSRKRVACTADYTEKRQKSESNSNEKMSISFLLEKNGFYAVNPDKLPQTPACPDESKDFPTFPT